MFIRRRSRFLPRLGVAVLLAGLPLASAVAQPAQGCPDAPVSPLPVPRLSRALDKDTEAVIVAFGSSSTQGVMASSRAHSYPAVLQAELSAALPLSHVAVLNRGVGGEDVAEELARLEADVLAARPALVLWQVGANAVLRRTDPDAFKRLVVAGVRRMQAAGADVVLVDNQRSPAILAAPGQEQIERALADAAAQTGAGLFSRDALMARWEQNGRPAAEFIAPDGLHHNDRGYRCVARALADAVLQGLEARTVTAGRTTSVTARK